MSHQSQRGVGLVETAGVDEPDPLIGCKLASGFIRKGAKYRARALSDLGRRDERQLVRHQPSTAVDVGARVLTSSEPGEELRQARHLRYTDQTGELANCNVYIVTVPQPHQISISACVWMSSVSV